MTKETLKPCPAEFQAVSNNMMELHRLTEAVDNHVTQTLLPSLDPAVSTLKREGMLLAEAYAMAILPLREIALVSAESRAMHFGVSEVLRKYGYELPTVLTRGPGGGR
jgi:hypothetical protein